jgi:hypothetical protein
VGANKGNEAPEIKLTIPPVVFQYKSFDPFNKEILGFFSNYLLKENLNLCVSIFKKFSL